LREPIGLCFETPVIHNRPGGRGKVIHIGGGYDALVSDALSADVNNFETGISCVSETGASF
jgi:hypothetical protein